MDDSALRSAAADLLAAASAEHRVVEWAISLVERGVGLITVEVVIGPRGPRTTLLFDALDDHRSTVLLESRPGQGRLGLQPLARLGRARLWARLALGRIQRFLDQLAARHASS